MRETGKRGKRVLTVLLSAALLAAGCGSGGEGDSAFDETAGTQVADLGGEPVYLEEAVFYTRMLQEQWEYACYDDFGEEMWQQETEDGGGTLEDALKNDVMATLTELHLLCAHADEYGVELTDAEREEIAGRAEAFMEGNTPAVLEAAGATKESVEHYLGRNALAAKVAEQIQADYTPETDGEAARVGRLTYALFSVTGTYDAEGNHTPFTEEEKEAVREEAERFAARAQELSDIAAAGEEFSHTVIDVYFNETSDGGAHELVAETARGLREGQVSGVIETEDGYYVVERVSDYDEEATAENAEELARQAKQEYLTELEAAWEQETPLSIHHEVWDTVRVEELLLEM